MEMKAKGRSLRIEISETDKRAWFRLYSHDAAEVRSLLDPGETVYIRARISEYLRKGGFLEELNDDAPARARGQTHGVRMLDDKFSLDAGSLELLCGDVELLGALGLYEPLMEALNWIRHGLDAPAGSKLKGVDLERFHSAEEILSRLLGNPIWNRPE